MTFHITRIPRHHHKLARADRQVRGEFVIDGSAQPMVAQAFRKNLRISSFQKGESLGRTTREAIAS